MKAAADESARKKATQVEAAGDESAEVGTLSGGPEPWSDDDEVSAPNPNADHNPHPQPYPGQQ